VCDDGNPCTHDVCKAVGVLSVDCKHAKASDGVLCDGLCTTGGTCKAGFCGGGKAKNCDDKNPCTTDACVAGKGCRSTPNNAVCNDGKKCTTNDRCSAGKCAGKAKACGDGNPCTTDTCTAATGTCKNTATTKAGSCNKGKPTAGWVWTNVLSKSCGPCHTGTGSSGKLGLGASAASARAAMLNKAVAATGCKSGKLVVAGKSGQSLLWRKIDATAAHGCGAKMPKGKALLSKALTDGVKAWIDGGALP